MGHSGRFIVGIYLFIQLSLPLLLCPRP